MSSSVYYKVVSKALADRSAQTLSKPQYKEALDCIRADVDIMLEAVSQEIEAEEDSEE